MFPVLLKWITQSTLGRVRCDMILPGALLDNYRFCGNKGLLFVCVEK
jgi:hypothetical protein